MTPRRLVLLWAVVLVVVASGVATAAPGHYEGYVPAVAHTPGLFGSVWTSDVWIYQQGATVIHLWFNPSGQDNSAGESVVIQLSDPVTRLPDVVAETFGADGVGSLHYLADGPVTITSRTWTQAPGGGGYGQSIEGIPVTQAAVPDSGQAGSLRMVADHDPGSRANLGLVNVSGVTTEIAIELFTADGEVAPGDSAFTLELAPYEMRQIGDVLARLGPAPLSGVIVRVGVVSDDGAVLAYLSTVDNATNDAAYEAGFRFGG